MNATRDRILRRNRKEGEMKKTNLSKFVIVGCMILMITGWAFPQDWPQWRGPNRDGKVSGFTAPQEWPEQLTQKWRTIVGLGDSTPALVRNRIYVFARQGEEEVTLCLDASNGKELWKDKYTAQAVTGPPSRHPGPRSARILSPRSCPHFLRRCHLSSSME
jgi:hypothetical protein